MLAKPVKKAYSDKRFPFFTADGALIKDEGFNPAALLPLLIALPIFVWWIHGMANLGTVKPRGQQIIFAQDAATMTPTVAGAPTEIILGQTGMDWRFEMFPSPTPIPVTVQPTATYEGWQPEGGYVAPTPWASGVPVTPYCVIGDPAFACSVVVQVTAAAPVVLPTLALPSPTPTVWYLTPVPRETRLASQGSGE